MLFYHLSISVLKVGRQLVGSLTVAAFFIFKRFFSKALISYGTSKRLTFQKFVTFGKLNNIISPTYSFLSLALALVLLQGCIREENPVLPHVAGNVTTRSIALSSDYRSQVFYNLDNDSIIQRSVKTDWDIAFDAADLQSPSGNLNTEGSKIYLNQAKFMYAWRTNKVEFEDVKDTVGFAKNRRWDASNNLDSLAIGAAKAQSNIYWIDRGLNEFNDPLDFVRFKIISASKEKYVFKVMRQGATNAEQYEIPRDTAYNRVYFSFETNKVVHPEPKKTEWDLQFTEYIHTFKDPYQPYRVVGVLLNPYSTQGVADSSLTFSKIDRTVAQNLKLTPQLDVIGYSWKAYSGNLFKIQLSYNYIVRDQLNYYWKLRFVDFYDSRGTKGTPKFEFQRL
jgi:hypothetical protein